MRILGQQTEWALTAGHSLLNSIMQWATRPRHQQRYLLAAVEQALHSSAQNRLAALAAEMGGSLRISLNENLIPDKLENEEMELLRGIVEYVVRQRYPTIVQVEITLHSPPPDSRGQTDVRFELSSSIAGGKPACLTKTLESPENKLTRWCLK
jgi:hypothetical protein